MSEQSSGGTAGAGGPTAAAGLDTMLDDFLHDVRTPLAAIRGAAEIVLQYGDDERVRIEFAQAIADEAQRMDDAILDTVRRLRETVRPRP